MSAANPTNSPESVTSSGTSSNNTPVQNSSPTATSTATATDTPPVLQINGNNPAIVQVGVTYADLGATIEGPQQDLNLGIDASVDGGATTTQDQIQIDTTQPGTHTILYNVTDQNGLIGYVTRTVIVAAATSTPATTATATSTTNQTTDTATSTSDTNTGAGDPLLLIASTTQTTTASSTLAASSTTQ